VSVFSTRLGLSDRYARLLEAYEAERVLELYDEAKHQRGMKGSSTGGQFVAKNSGTSPASSGSKADFSWALNRQGKGSGGGGKKGKVTGEVEPITRATSLSQNDSGAQVSALQKLLTAFGFSVVNDQDGQFGRDTEAAVRQLQHKLGLRETGHADVSLQRRLADAALLMNASRTSEAWAAPEAAEVHSATDAAWARIAAGGAVGIFRVAERYNPRQLRGHDLGLSGILSGRWASRGGDNPIPDASPGSGRLKPRHLPAPKPKAKRAPRKAPPAGPSVSEHAAALGALQSAKQRGDYLDGHPKMSAIEMRSVAKSLGVSATGTKAKLRQNIVDGPADRPGAVRKGVPRKAAPAPKAQSHMSQMTVDERAVARDLGLPSDHPLLATAQSIDEAPTRAEAERHVADVHPGDLNQVAKELGIQLPPRMSADDKRAHIVQSVISFGNAGAADESARREGAATPRVPNPDGLDSTGAKGLPPNDDLDDYVTSGLANLAREHGLDVPASVDENDRADILVKLRGAGIHEYGEDPLSLRTPEEEAFLAGAEARERASELDLLRKAASVGGGVGVLAPQTGRARQHNARLDLLRRQGLMKREGDRYVLTDAGRAHLAAQSSGPSADGLDSMDESALRKYAPEWDIASPRDKSADQLRRELRAQGVGSPQAEQAKRRAEGDAEDAVVLRDTVLENQIRLMARDQMSAMNGGYTATTSSARAAVVREHGVTPEAVDRALRNLGVDPTAAEIDFRDMDRESAPLPARRWDEPLSTDKATRAVQLENRIRAAYLELANTGPGADHIGGSPHGQVWLRDIRDRIGTEASKAEVDEALTAFSRNREGRLDGYPAQRHLTVRDRAASVHYGGQDRWLLAINDPSPKPLPAPASPAALSSDPAVREVEVENRIRAAYREAIAANDPGPFGPARNGRENTNGDYVMLTGIRGRIGSDVSREEVDAALVRLGRDGAIQPQEDQKWLTPAQREAAVTFGTEPMHMIALRDPSPRPIPSSPASPSVRKMAAPGAAGRVSVTADRLGSLAADLRKIPSARRKTALGGKSPVDVVIAYRDRVASGELKPEAVDNLLQRLLFQTRPDSGYETVKGVEQQRVARDAGVTVDKDRRIADAIKSTLDDLRSPGSASTRGKAAPEKKAVPRATYELASGYRGPTARARHTAREEALLAVAAGDIGTGLGTRFEALQALESAGYVRRDGNRWQLTAQGREYVDRKSADKTYPALDVNFVHGNQLATAGLGLGSDRAFSGRRPWDANGSGKNYLLEADTRLSRQSPREVADWLDAEARKADRYDGKDDQDPHYLRDFAARLREPDVTAAWDALRERHRDRLAAVSARLGAGDPSAKATGPPAVAKMARAKAPKVDIPSVAAALRNGGDQVEVIEFLDAHTDLTAPKLLELATELGIDIPPTFKGKPNRQMYLSQQIPLRFGRGAPGALAAQRPAPAAFFDYQRLASQLIDLETADQIIAALSEATTLANLRKVAKEMGLVLPAGRRLTADELRLFMAEQIVRDRGRWSWR